MLNRLCSTRRNFPLIFLCLILAVTAPASLAASRSDTVTLQLSTNAADYLAPLLRELLADAGRPASISVALPEDPPTSRQERMLELGEISVMMLGETASRNERFLPIRVNMTDNLINQRILFIPHGSQADYDGVETLDDFRATGKVAGMGKAWRDLAIWQANDLPVLALAGEWRRLYRMIGAGGRGVDYLPRGATEIASEWQDYPYLAVEEHLVFQYESDHILYVAPDRPRLHALLKKLLTQAEEDGRISAWARAHFAEVFEPPVSLQQRTAIPLQLNAPD